MAPSQHKAKLEKESQWAERNGFEQMKETEKKLSPKNRLVKKFKNKFWDT